MSLIKDVREEICKLDLSRKSLRNFGLLVGGVFCALAALAAIKDFFPAGRYAAGTAGTLLIAAGATVPGKLRTVYIVWMGIALSIGWVVSRVLLVILFYLLITPIGFLARLAGKRFLPLGMEGHARDSYWFIRDKNRIVNYEKMY